MNTISILAASIGGACGAAQPNLLVNPGFELGSGTNVPGWELSSDDLTTLAATDLDPASGDSHLRYQGQILEFFGTGIIRQQIDLAGVDTSLPFEFSGSFNHRPLIVDTPPPPGDTFYYGAFALGFITWFDDQGPLGSDSFEVPVPDMPLNEWTAWSSQPLAAPAGTTGVTLGLWLLGGQGTLLPGGVDVTATLDVDDLSFAVVPTPGTLLVLGGGTIAALRRRR